MDRDQKAVGVFGGLIFLAWFLSVIVSLSVMVGIVYVAIHFLHKFW